MSILNKFIRSFESSNEMSKTSLMRELRFYMRRIQLEEKIFNCKDPGISNNKYCDHEVIVSLTTYGRRLHDVCFTIESLMQQTMLPNRIILNLDPSSQNQPLPIALKRQMERGLSVVVVDDDIKSYKKLIPTLKTNPNAIVITADDDVTYDFDIIERLFNAYISDPKSIHACRTHCMKFDINGALLPYAFWEMSAAGIPAHNFATGVGGVLYPPYSLSAEVFNKDVFTSICPTADDVWFNAMAKLNGTNICKIVTRNPEGVDYESNPEIVDGLCKINTGKYGRNDEQIRAVFTKYGIYDLIR